VTNFYFYFYNSPLYYFSFIISSDNLAMFYFNF